MADVLQLSDKVTYVLALIKDLSAGLVHLGMQLIPAFATIARSVDAACFGLGQNHLGGRSTPENIDKSFVDFKGLEGHLIIVCCLYLVATAPRFGHKTEDLQRQKAGSVPEDTADLIIACLRSILDDVPHEDYEYVAPC
jgi:hypothetical protein